MGDKTLKASEIETAIPKDLIAKLKEKHPKIAWRRLCGYEILFRPLTPGEWEKFKNMNASDDLTKGSKVNALENLQADNMLYPAPGSPEAEAMFDDMPALKTVIGNAICKRAGMTEAIEEGEF